MFLNINFIKMVMFLNMRADHRTVTQPIRDICEGHNSLVTNNITYMGFGFYS